MPFLIIADYITILEKSLTSKSLHTNSMLVKSTSQENSLFQSSWGMTYFYLCDGYHNLTFQFHRFLEPCCAWTNVVSDIGYDIVGLVDHPLIVVGYGEASKD